MQKEDAISIIDKVMQTDYNEFTKTELLIIRRYCAIMAAFKYNILVNYINYRKNQQPKMGGQYVDFHKAIAYLKQELRKANKIHDNTRT